MPTKINIRQLQNKSVFITKFILSLTSKNPELEKEIQNQKGAFEITLKINDTEVDFYSGMEYMRKALIHDLDRQQQEICDKRKNLNEEIRTAVRKKLEDYKQELQEYIDRFWK